MEKKDFHFANKQTLPVIIETTRYKIQGSIHILYNHRASDELNSKENFLAVTKAQVFDIETGKCLDERPFIAVNKNHIIMLIEAK